MLRCRAVASEAGREGSAGAVRLEVGIQRRLAIAVQEIACVGVERRGWLPTRWLAYNAASGERGFTGGSWGRARGSLGDRKPEDMSQPMRWPRAA
jgi:hypothetical protein